MVLDRRKGKVFSTSTFFYLLYVEGWRGWGRGNSTIRFCLPVEGTNTAQRGWVRIQGVRDYHWPWHTQRSENVGEIHTDELYFIDTETEA